MKRSDWLYDAQVSGFQARASPPRDRRELFMHFGHWEAPGEAPALASFPAAQERLDARLRGLGELGPGAHVLDAGCGVGGTVAALLETANLARLVGLNIDPRQVEAARRLVTPSPTCAPEWVVGDACALPFDPESFDCVFAVECLPHFPSRAAFFARAATVLRVGGRLVLSDFVPTDALRAARRQGTLPAGFERCVQTDLAPWSDFFGDEDHDLACARAAGLALEAEIDATLATLPTYDVLIPGPPRGLDAPNEPPDPARGMTALAWAQRRGLLRLRYYAFSRRASAGPP